MSPVKFAWDLSVYFMYLGFEGLLENSPKLLIMWELLEGISETRFLCYVVSLPEEINHLTNVFLLQMLALDLFVRLWPVTENGFIGTNFTSFAGSELFGILSCTADSGRWVCVWIRMNQDQFLEWSGQISFCLAFLGLADIIQSEADTPFCTDPVSCGGVRGHSGSVMGFISAKWSPGWFSQSLLYCALWCGWKPQQMLSSQKLCLAFPMCTVVQPWWILIASLERWSRLWLPDSSVSNPLSVCVSFMVKLWWKCSISWLPLQSEEVSSFLCYPFVFVG